MMIPDLSIFTSSTAWYFIPISTVCFTYFMFKSYYREKNVTVQLPSDDPSTPYPRYRHQKGLTLIQLPQASTSLTSVLDLLNFAKDHHGSKKAFGSRSLIRIHEEEKWVTKKINNQTEEIKEKKTWQFFEKSDYQWWTYHQVFDKAVNLGAGLKRYLPSHSMFCIYANTCVEWQLLAQACFTQSITIVTAYETLGLDGLLHSLNEAEVQGLFLTEDLLPNLLGLIDRVPSLKLIVYVGSLNPSCLTSFQSTRSSTTTSPTFVHMDTLYEEGKTHPLAFTSPSTSDTALIMYTSGSTGPPKGVVLTHANLLSGVGGVETTLRPVLRDDDVYLAYLPLAHVLEFMVELVCLYAGIAVGYGHPKTLVDTNMRHCVSDLRALQPTMMAGVPAVWEAVRKGVLSKVTSRPWWVRAMFQGAMQWKAWCQTHRLPSWLYWVHDRVVFKKIRDQVGGRLRFALSGGAPISLDTQAFLSTALCPLYQGYGLTESGGICILFDPELPLQFQHIGPPVPCTELMLVPVDTYPHQPQVGELWIRGPNITSGYFKQPKLTADVFQSKTGWFQTGDIARHLPNGQFQIIDRVKNLVKVLNGEYVALEKLESFYSHCMYVQRLCLYADARANGIVAIVVPSPAPLLALATSLGMAANTDLDQLCEHPEVLHTIMKELQALGKKLKLASFEMVFGTILSPEDWTPQNQLLTAAMKLKRRDIYAKFKSQIEALYASVK